MDNEISMSIEETNKIRISLGMKPLKVEASESQATDPAEENYALYKQQLLNAKREEEIKKSISRSKIERQSKKRLIGNTIAQLQDDDDNAAWIQKQKAASLAHSTAISTEVPVNSLKKNDYTSSDLRGMEISHKIDDIMEAGETILVLKDSMIGDSDDGKDENVNVELMDKVRSRKNVEDKRKKNMYTAYDDEEFNLDALSKPSILAHYDEEIDGPSESSFKIGKQGKVHSRSEAKEKLEQSKTLKSGTISLEYKKNLEIQDYYTNSEHAELTAFKKPKKKREKKTRRKSIDEEVKVETFETTSQQFSHKKSIGEDNFVDDEDLQAALSKSRRMNSKIKKSNIEDIVEKVKEHSLRLSEQHPEESAGMVISTTSEFVNNLSVTSLLDSSENLDRKPVDIKVVDTIMKQSNVERPLISLRTESEDEDKSKTFDIEMDVDMDIQSTHEKKEDDSTFVETILDEPLATGLASTLKLLSQKGLISKMTEEERNRDAIQKERQKWILEQKKNELLGTKLVSAKDKSKFLEDRFKNYTPDVQIQYTDEFGRNLTPKEAYKQLCYKFHGKAPGKAKTERRLKKIKDERDAGNLLNSEKPLGTVKAIEERTKSLGTAHLVVQKGNKMLSLPEADVLLPEKSVFLNQKKKVEANLADSKKAKSE